MVRQLRKGNGQYGLVLANGGVVTYQHVVCLSSRPRSSPYPDRNPLPEVTADVPVPTVDAQAEGEAVIEVSMRSTPAQGGTGLIDIIQTYTVEFNGDGEPVRGFIVGRLKRSGHRFLANNADHNTLCELLNHSKEPIGREGCVFRDVELKGRNLFRFDITANL